LQQDLILAVDISHLDPNRVLGNGYISDLERKGGYRDRRIVEAIERALKNRCRECGVAYRSIQVGISPAGTEAGGSGDETSSTLISPRALLDGVTLQDRKNVIRDDSISHRILTATRLPSFAECVYAVRTVNPADEEEKDTSLNPGWRYNHFVQAGAVICIEPEEGDVPLVIAYHRVPQVGLPPERTLGISVLWGASFTYNVRPGGKAMDRWMDQVTTDRSGAQRQFVDENGSVLADLLRYKIDLVDLRLNTTPFAVITSDQRNDRDDKGWMGRVYTQYVFRVRLSARELLGSTRPELGMRAPGIQVCCLPEQEMKAEMLKQTFWNKQKNTPNLMDILAWRGMFERNKTISIGKAALVKGFEIVPKDDTRRKGSWQ
jgi:hypothetical protein